MAGRLEGDQGVKRVSNSEDASGQGMGPLATGSFELVFAVGKRIP
jgi:hypothetical protein